MISSFLHPLPSLSMVIVCIEPVVQPWYKEGWGVAIIGAVTGCVCTWLGALFINDFNARKECNGVLCELKRIFAKLASYQTHRNQGEEGYLSILVDMEKVIEDLDIVLIGLCFRPPELDQLVSRSLEVFKKLNPNDENQNFRPHVAASNLMQCRNPSDRPKGYPKKVIESQKFLKRSFWYRARKGRFFNSARKD